MRKNCLLIFIYCFLCAFFIVRWTAQVVDESKKQRLKPTTISSMEYREQNIGETTLELLKCSPSPGETVGKYLLESKFGYEKTTLHNAEKRWKDDSNYIEYINTTQAIWDDVKYFPIPESTSDPNLTVNYSNSWMSERTFGGQRGHEGCDIMANKAVRGLYPVLSMTDGVVEKMGWLEKGGYRIGIKAPRGAYFYYAHLDSYADIKIGEQVKAGDILGYMGDSGYGPEGTVGQFAVHLHLGIYIYPDNIETSVNPYWVLRYVEKSKVKCYTKI